VVESTTVPEFIGSNTRQNKLLLSPSGVVCIAPFLISQILREHRHASAAQQGFCLRAQVDHESGRRSHLASFVLGVAALLAGALAHLLAERVLRRERYAHELDVVEVHAEARARVVPLDLGHRAVVLDGQRDEVVGREDLAAKNSVSK